MADSQDLCLNSEEPPSQRPHLSTFDHHNKDISTQARHHTKPIDHFVLSYSHEIEWDPEERQIDQQLSMH